VTTTVLGDPPSWVKDLSETEIRAHCGNQSFERGMHYAFQGAVAELHSSSRRLLQAKVSGSGGRLYQTEVNALINRRTAWPICTCSCPVQFDCKHVVAVLVVAREWAMGAELPGGPEPTARWEQSLADLVVPRKSEATPAIGLQVDLVTPRNAPLARLRIRPVARGRTGWVKTGASWRDLERGYSGVPVDPAQRELVRDLLAHWRGRASTYYNSYNEPQVFLDDVGPAIWVLLRQALESGFALVGSGERDVRLASEPARAVLDFRRPAGATHVTFTAGVQLSDGSTISQDTLLVGEPAHGLVIIDDDALVLVPMAAPIGATTRRLLARGPTEIPESDLPRFFAFYYPSLAQQYSVLSGDETVSFPEVGPPRLVVSAEFGDGHASTLMWEFGYRVGDSEIRVSGDGGTSYAGRDLDAEHELLAKLSEVELGQGLQMSDDGHLLTGRELHLVGMQTARLVDRVLPALLTDLDVDVHVIGHPAQYHESLQSPVIEVSTQDGSDPDWFDLQVAVSVDDQQVPLAPLLTAIAHGEENLLLDSGIWFRLDRPELQRLRELIEDARSLEDRPAEALRLARVHAGLWEELVELGVVGRQSARWKESAGALLSLEELPRPAQPETLHATLRPYQLDGYHWLSLLWDLRLGGVLADDMGLGKTMQTLAMAARAAERGTLGGHAGPLLVVAPTSVVTIWAEQSKVFCPSLRTVVVGETERRSGRQVADLSAGADLVITSYALLRIDDDAYQAVTWSGLVLDEAQFVKNHLSKTYHSARRLPASFKLAITGTPMENSVMDLWSLLSITAPGLFPNPQRFASEYRRPIESGAAPEQLDSLRRRVRPLMLRRTKEQVASDLPPKIEQKIEVVLNPQHRRIYDTHLTRERQRVLRLVDDLDRNRFAILKSLTTLRQLSLDASLVDDRHAGKVRSSKIDVLVEQLREVAAEGHRALVFSQFTRFLSLVRERLTKEGIESCYLDGRTRDRARRIAEFTEGDAPAFLISLKAGGFGLNLTAADYVFVLDPWWNPATEEQAIDRAHRIGQDRPVMVYRLVASDTIEEKVVALQQRKRDLFASVIDGGSAAESKLTAEDIRELLKS
jgi:superfamily II DNA or RNA helicase